MIATVVSPGSIPEFVHPPVPGESHDFYGDTHLESIKLPAPVAIHSSSTSTQSRSAQFLDPLANTNVLNSNNSSSNSNTRVPHERSESVRELTSGANLVEGAEQTEDSSDDALWARLVEGCINRQPELVQDILMQSTKLKDSIDNVSSTTGMNPLHFAASRGHEEIVRILIDQAGAGVDIQDREGETALLKASYSGYYPVVCFLLKRGANVHQRDKDGWTALHNASSKGFIDIAQVLLEKGEADVNARSKMGHTPLINAASKGDVAMVLYFLNHAGANPLLKNAFSEMAYDVAAANSEAYLCSILQSSERQYWKSEHTGDQAYDPLVIHSTVLMTVHENQRATSSFPLSLMTPKFSAGALTQQDVCGPWSLPNGRPSTKDDVHLPLVTSSGVSNSRANMQRGWFWLTEWVIDKTDPTVDTEGWQYGKSLTEANQQWSAIYPTSGSNWVRRRKWIRVMKKRVDLINNTEDILEVSDSGQPQYQELAGNYVKRANLALRLDDGFLDTTQELVRYRQAIQILLNGIKVDKDATSKQAASVLVGEYLQHAEDLAESIKQRDMLYASLNQPETPRPRIASRSSEGSIGSNNELRSLTLQKSRPFDPDTIENVFHPQHGVDADDHSQESSQGSFASAPNILDNVSDGIGETLQDTITDAVSAQEQIIQEQNESFETEFSSMGVNGDQHMASALEVVSHQTSGTDDARVNIPVLTSGSPHQVPDVTIIDASPSTGQSDPFPMTRLTRSPRPANPSPSSSSNPAQLSSSLSSSCPGQSSASPTQIPSSRPSRSASLGLASGSGSGTGQSSSGSQLQYQRVYHGQTTANSISHSSYNSSQNDGSLGVYHGSNYAPELTSHSSSRSSSSSNLQSTAMARNASSSSLMSECPVCGAILAGLEGGKSAQEAHVQECLEVYKLPADSPLIDQECAICFEEFVAD
ncbi:hypothetical protein BGZ79_006337 [Entomortierella chlamydospora]|nr:hypothetical protein BGZ79_006337 [Entomortierella chlamydospora]